ncbi:MAG: hypothetical protein ACK48Y_15170, partial [Planctomyces sp.]
MWRYWYLAAAAWCRRRVTGPGRMSGRRAPHAATAALEVVVLATVVLVTAALVTAALVTAALVTAAFVTAA